jgi:hypothetical protein
VNASDDPQQRPAEGDADMAAARIKSHRAALLPALILGLTACIWGSDSKGGSTATAATAKMCGFASGAPSGYDHVIWIWFENHSYPSIVGSSSAPYLNGVVGNQCALATNFHNETHPSLPNYLAATSGSTQGLTDNCLPSVCRTNAPSLFRQLENAHKTWKGYADAMPSNCSAVNRGTYAVKHNPPPYYTDIQGTCSKYNVPLGSASSGALTKDLAAGTLPSFAFISPDLCHDMHNCSVNTGDTWLNRWLNLIVGSSTYKAGRTAVFVTWDEGQNGTHGANCSSPSNTDPTCHVATYVIGPAVQPGARVSTRYTHYSMLRTTEEMLGLGFLGNAGGAASMRSNFRV